MVSVARFYLASIGELYGEAAGRVHILRPAGESGGSLRDDLDLLTDSAARHAQLFKLRVHEVVHHVRPAHVEGALGHIPGNLADKFAGDETAAVLAVLAGLGDDMMYAHEALALQAVKLVLGDNVVLKGAAVD